MEKSVFFGVRKSDRAKINLGPPSWECGWYWGGFGYLGNNNEHYHLDSHMVNGYLIPEYLTSVYELNPVLNSEKVWLFCELMTTAYALRRAADIFTRGGSNVTISNLRDLIKDRERAENINSKLLPEIFSSIESLFTEVP